MSNSKIYFQAFPLGICSECLKQWKAAGLPGQLHEVEPGGASILAGYCAHRESGFWAAVGDAGVVTEWTIRTPISIEAWQRYVAALPNSIRGVRVAMLDSADAEAQSVQ